MSPRARRPRSSSPAGPRRGRPTPALLAEVVELRSVVDARPPGAVGRRAEAAPAAAPASSSKARRCAAGHADEIVGGAAGEGGRARARRRRAARQAAPARARAEARQGARRGARRARRPATFEELGGGRFRVPPGTSSARTRCSSSGPARRAGRSPAADGVTVALDTAVDDELALEGRVYELIHRVNSMRKDAGLELTDRIKLDACRRRRRPPPARRLDREGDACGRGRGRRRRRARDQRRLSTALRRSNRWPSSSQARVKAGMAAPTSTAGIAVLGAGPASLAAAHLFGRAEGGQRIRGRPQVGGIAKTVEHDGFRFDLGGHASSRRCRG